MQKTFQFTKALKIISFVLLLPAFQPKLYAQCDTINIHLEDAAICDDDNHSFGVDILYKSIVWSTGAINIKNITIEEEGWYGVTVMDANGCTGSDSAYLTVYDLPDAGLENHEIFINETYNNPPVQLTVADEMVSYHWSTGETTRSITVKDTGTYYVSVVDANGCENSDTSVITGYPFVFGELDGNDPFTLNDFIIILDYWLYLQDLDDMTYDFPVAADVACDCGVIDLRDVKDIFWYVFISAFYPDSLLHGCDYELCGNGQDTGKYYKASVRFDEGDLIFTADGDLSTLGVTGYSLPPGQSMYLSKPVEMGGGSHALYYNNTDTMRIAWFKSRDTALFENQDIFKWPIPHDTIDAITVYFEYSNTNDHITYDSATFCFNGATLIDIHLENAAICNGDDYTFGVNHYDSIEWRKGPDFYAANVDNIIVNDEGWYHVTIMNANGCRGHDSAYLTVYDLPDAGLEGHELFINETYNNPPVQLTAAGEMTSYHWSTGESTRSITVKDTGTYYVTVVDANGCENPDTSIVTGYLFKFGELDGTDPVTDSDLSMIVNFWLYLRDLDDMPYDFPVAADAACDCGVIDLRDVKDISRHVFISATYPDSLLYGCDYELCGNGQDTGKYYKASVRFDEGDLIFTADGDLGTLGVTGYSLPPGQSMYLSEPVTMSDGSLYYNNTDTMRIAWFKSRDTALFANQDIFKWPIPHDTIDAITVYFEYSNTNEHITYDSATFNFNDVSIKVLENINSGIRLYPNPVKNNVVVSANETIASYRVVNIAGKIFAIDNGIFRKHFEVNTSHLSEGAYIIILINKEGNITTRQFLKK